MTTIAFYTFTDEYGQCWRVLHWDARRDMYTVERARRFFKGRLWLAAGQYIDACRQGWSKGMRACG